MSAQEMTRLDAATLGAKIAAKEVSSAEVTRACLDRIAETDGKYQAFLHVAEEQALAAAARVDAGIAADEELPSPLAGVPLALKDVFTTTDMPTTCGSKILEGWTSPYDSTVAVRLRAAEGHNGKLIVPGYGALGVVFGQQQTPQPCVLIVNLLHLGLLVPV